MEKGFRCQSCKKLFPIMEECSCGGVLEEVLLVAFYAKAAKGKKSDWDKRQERKGRQSDEYQDWRIAVFTRDQLTCQQCGQQGGELSAHHILPWATHPAFRYVVSNGQTLCIDCHRKLHQK